MPLQLAKANADDETKIVGARLTHANKVLYPQQGLTKRNLRGISKPRRDAC